RLERFLGQGLPYHTCEPISVGSKENRIPLLGREGRMSEQLVAKGRKTDCASQLLVRRFERAGRAEVLKKVSREVAALKWPVPAEDIRELRARFSRPGVNKMVAGGRNGGKAVILGF